MDGAPSAFDPRRVSADLTGSDRWIAGVDVGGTSVRAGLVPAGRKVARAGGGPGAGAGSGRTGLGDVLARPTKTAAGRSPRAVARAVAAMVRELDGGAVGIGVGVPGPLDVGRRIIRQAPNLGWTEAPLADMIEDEAGLPVVLENDADCAAYGEWRFGAGRGARCLVGLTLGTGIGGGIVLDGRLHRGVSGAAAEVGHVTVDPNGRMCGCGSRGCVEAHASGSAIAALGAAAGIRGAATAQAVCEAARRGDGAARRVVADAADALAIVVAGLVHVLNPDVVVVGGGVAAAGDLLFGPLCAGVKRRVFPSAWQACRIVASELDGTAGVVGAACLFEAEIERVKRGSAGEGRVGREGCGPDRAEARRSGAESAEPCPRRT